jgi:hypothetical protein
MQDVLSATRTELNATIDASETAARMAAEIIAAQQAEIRRLEGEVVRAVAVETERCARAIVGALSDLAPEATVAIVVAAVRHAPEPSTVGNMDQDFELKDALKALETLSPKVAKAVERLTIGGASAWKRRDDLRAITDALTKSERENVRLVREHALLAFKLGRQLGQADDTQAKLATLLVAASAAYDYFSDKTDADFDGGHFIGNREASLASELAEAIRRAKGERA